MTYVLVGGTSGVRALDLGEGLGPMYQVEIEVLQLQVAEGFLERLATPELILCCPSI